MENYFLLQFHIIFNKYHKGTFEKINKGKPTVVKINKNYNVWETYEQEKRMIDLSSKSSEEYERRIKELCERLKI